ncbi:hypothetical protein IJF93_00920 [Candidatus Saccharibacteria bacterium]|nr:hypothetical protein [Candidatus Saccharibacteria bacterium]
MGFIDNETELFYVDKSSGEEALERKLASMKAEGFKIISVDDSDERASNDHEEIEPGWKIIKARRPVIELGKRK